MKPSVGLFLEPPPPGYLLVFWYQHLQNEASGGQCEDVDTKTPGENQEEVALEKKVKVQPLSKKAKGKAFTKNCILLLH